MFAQKIWNDERRLGPDARLDAELPGSSEDRLHLPSDAIEHFVAFTGRDRPRHQPLHHVGTVIVGGKQQCRAACELAGVHRSVTPSPFRGIRPERRIAELDPPILGLVARKTNPHERFRANSSFGVQCNPRKFIRNRVSWVR